MNFGEKLKKYRSENKITRENFAKQIEISPKTLYFYETGQRKNCESNAV